MRRIGGIHCKAVRKGVDAAQLISCRVLRAVTGGTEDIVGLSVVKGTSVTVSDRVTRSAKLVRGTSNDESSIAGLTLGLVSGLEGCTISCFRDAAKLVKLRHKCSRTGVTNNVISLGIVVCTGGTRSDQRTVNTKLGCPVNDKSCVTSGA